MDLLYTVSRKPNCNPSKSGPDYDVLHDGRTLCCISSQSIVAFSAITELEDCWGKSWGSHVYIADLNVPWHCHKVISNKAIVTALEWDVPGDKLLIADVDGNVQLWTFKDHLLNEWVCLGTVSFPGEHILSALFFHNGKKTNLVPDMKDAMQYTEKFKSLPLTPSVRGFGGSPIDGCVVVTATGMIGAIICLQEGQGVPLLLHTSESLSSTRSRITAADICFGKNGNFMVALSSGRVSLPVHCVRVTVKLVDEKCVLNTQALPSFFPHSGPINDIQYRHVSQLKFAARDDADCLIIATNGDSGCVIELWELREKPVPIHKTFQPKNHNNQSEPYKTMVWQHQCHYVAQCPVVCVTTSKLSLVSAVPPVGYITVALSDGSIHCLFRDTLKQAAQTSQNVIARNDDTPSTKQQKLHIRISHADMSCIGLVLAAVDAQGHLYVYRLSPFSEPSGPISVSCASTLLEYCMMTGFDWWDVLVSLRPEIIDAVCERFSENFNRQSAPIQQFYYIKQLNIKTSLYRLSMNGQSKAADLTSLLMLHSVATAFKSLLRPSDLSNHEKGPAESLANVMTESITDVDKVLLHLEAKEFTVEPSTLQSLQQLIQWVADLALNLLARLPEQRQASNKGSGYELLRDYKALNTLRELLVIIRIWGLLRQSCLPVFVRSAENLDVLALLFKLLSRLIQNTEPDENLIDDCCLLPSQVMIPPLNSPQKLIAITSPLFFCQSLPIQLEWGTEPDSLLFVPEINPVEGAMQSEQIIDCTRHTYLGKHPSVVKQCTRCAGVAFQQFLTRTAAIRAWDMRWARECLCGGHWRLHYFSSI
ncbi:mediator of RNA polymerase II transcription subunit 16 isoform X1 [Schistocerca piceifrons]|uniref:mediator of RNA polymerase II transcription subunit 16 isoform X1 n=1 Tax=Schistocerca piceifrons TaxID=274613 RepID=UPI001F5EE482|nr:mediator of RNA polymerase II transcription subunit 16 isoform X1 [Schistocerca piceifrons]